MTIIYDLLKQREVVSALASQPTPHTGSDHDGQDDVLNEKAYEKVKVECRHTKLFIDAHRNISREYIRCKEHI